MKKDVSDFVTKMYGVPEGEGRTSNYLGFVAAY